MVRAPVLDEPRVSDEDRRRLLDWSGWVPGGQPEMSPGDEVRFMCETAPRGVEFEELVGMAEKHISCAGEDLVLRRLDEDLIDDRDISFYPLHRFM
jgi:hypothetical protein